MQGSCIRSAAFAAFAALITLGAASPRQELSPRPSRGAPETGVRLEANRGQTDASVDFVARCRGCMAWIRPTDVVLGLAGAAKAGDPLVPGARPELDGTIDVLDVRFVDATSHAPRPTDRLPGASNYFVGQDESKWVRGAPSYAAARYADTWPGVGVTWRGGKRALRFDFDVAAGADASAIVLAFDGADSVAVEDDGSLHVAARRGEVVVSKPVAFQAGSLVGARWKTLGGLRVGFDVPGRDPSLPLVIDPWLGYSTYVGGAATESAGGVAVDSSSNVFVGGWTQSADFPATAGAYRTSKNNGTAASYDGFCMKFDSSGSTLSYATYFGGTGDDGAYALTLDGAGAAYLAGLTKSTDFPLTAGAFRTTWNGNEGFVFKLDATGSSIAYSVPGTSLENRGPIYAIAVDSSGAAFVPWGPDNVSYVSKLNAAGTILWDTTFSQIVSTMRMQSIVLDSTGSIYCAGYATSNPAPTSTGAYQTAYGGGASDAIVGKIHPGGGIAWCTCLGGAGADAATGLTLDASGNVWVVGSTSGSGFPTTSGAWRTTYGGGTSDAFVAKLSASGSSLLYSTFLGGAGADGATAVARVRQWLCVVGTSTSTDFPTTGDALQSTNAGGADATLTVLDVAGGAPAYSTLWGGAQNEQLFLNNVAAQPTGDVYLCVTQTASTNFPTSANAFDATSNGTDGALVKFAAAVPATYSIGPNPFPQWTQGAPWTAPLTSVGAIGTVAWTIVADALPPGFSLSPAGVLSGMSPTAGSWPFTLQAADSIGQVVRARVTLVVNPPPVAVTPATLHWTRTRPLKSNPLSANFGTPPFAWAVVSGVAPPGLTMASDGSLVGTPTTRGTFTFTVAATDARGVESTTTPYAVDVAEVPSIRAQTLADRTETSEGGEAFESIDGTPPMSWSVVGGAFPFVKSIDASKGDVHAKTIAAGVYSFTLRVTDVAGATGDRAFTLKLNPTPKIDTGELPLAAAGRPYAATLHAHDGTPPARWYAFTPLPFGMAVDADSGRLTGVPDAGGVASIPVLYVDDGGGTAQKTLALDVAARLDLSRGKASAKTNFGPRMPAGPRWFFVELVAGSRLDLAVKLGRSDVLPVLYDAQGTQVDAGDLTKLKGFVVPATGRYFLKLTPPATPKRATVTIAARVVAPTKLSGLLSLTTTAVEIPFSVVAGSTVSVTVKAKRRGVVPKIVALLQNGADLAAGAHVRMKGSLVQIRLTTKPAAGDLRLVLAAATDGTGDASYVVEIKPPRRYDAGLSGIPAGD